MGTKKGKKPNKKERKQTSARKRSNVDNKLVNQLKGSSDKIGQLLPRIKSKDGELIDGRHRTAADEDWVTVQRDDIDTEEKKIRARLALNWTRRSMKREEITRELIALCKLHPECEGHYSDMIVKLTGYDIDTVEKYLPAEYKQKRERRIPPALLYP